MPFKFFDDLEKREDGEGKSRCFAIQPSHRVKFNTMKLSFFIIA
jgi:hypothetical protein